MKRFFVYIVAVGCLLVLYGCPFPFDPHECDYEYPINIKNLKDTIKTTDTLWVENDFDPRFCLDKSTFKNEIIVSLSTPMKLVNDSLVFYNPIIVTTEGEYMSYGIEIRRQDGRYKLKYGIVFPDTGIYSLKAGYLGHFSEELNKVSLFSYFDTPSNNIYLIPEKLHYGYAKEPYNYVYYFICVIE